MDCAFIFAIRVRRYVPRTMNYITRNGHVSDVRGIKITQIALKLGTYLKVRDIQRRQIPIARIKPGIITHIRKVGRVAPMAALPSGDLIPLKSLGANFAFPSWRTRCNVCVSDALGHTTRPIALVSDVGRRLNAVGADEFGRPRGSALPNGSEILSNLTTIVSPFLLDYLTFCPSYRNTQHYVQILPQWVRVLSIVT